MTEDRRKPASPEGDVLNLLRTYLIPPLLIITAAMPVFIAMVGRGEFPSWQTVAFKTLGNPFAWGCVVAMWTWAFLSLKVSARKHEGPPTNSGYRPVYVDNGVLYYWVSLVVFFTLQALVPNFSTTLYNNMPELLGASNITALLLCALLWVKGKRCPDQPDDLKDSKSCLYDFYKGLELHPRLFGLDVKQFTNCRVGIMAWQILILAFYIAGVEKHGFSAATLVNMILQSVYLAKFFWWESGYFNTLDIILDRAGYYLCWGCLVWVPALYTFSSYYLVAHLPIMLTPYAIITGMVGMFAILMNYRVDYEKQLFRSDSNCVMWGRPAKYMVASYKNTSGKLRESKLLLSGCWGVARHLNYFFELLAALAWCLPGIGLGVWPFSYFIFLVILLVHRTFRDEEKCATKYGEDWKKYCLQVPYRIIPYVF